MRFAPCSCEEQKQTFKSFLPGLTLVLLVPEGAVERHHVGVRHERPRPARTVQRVVPVRVMVVAAARDAEARRQRAPVRQLAPAGAGTRLLRLLARRTQHSP